MDVHRYLVIYERTPTGYSAYAPDVPGCVAAGDTIEETEGLMRDALVMHLESLEEEGIPIPISVTRADYVEIPA
jgi:predicted RNase H-like HicB family nuclease